MDIWVPFTLYSYVKHRLVNNVILFIFGPTYVTVEWGPGGRASQTGSISADVTDVKHHLPNVVDKYSAVLTFDPEAKKNDLLTSAPISVLLLYRRDDLQIARRAVDLRIRLQSECGAKIKVSDFFSFLNVYGAVGCNM